VAQTLSRFIPGYTPPTRETDPATGEPKPWMDPQTGIDLELTMGDVGGGKRKQMAEMIERQIGFIPGIITKEPLDTGSFNQSQQSSGSPGNVLINGRSAVHAGSGGTLSTMDVCNTPRGDSCPPRLCTNVAKSTDAAKTAGSVKINGNPACIKSSIFSKSTGDQPGRCGGVSSGTIKGKAEFITASPNVMIEGEPAVRQFDLMISNNRNTPPAPVMQSGGARPPFLDAGEAEAKEASPSPFRIPVKAESRELHQLRSLIITEDHQARSANPGQSGANLRDGNGSDTFSIPSVQSRVEAITTKAETSEEHKLASDFAFQQLQGLTNLMQERPMVSWLAHIFGYDIPIKAYVDFQHDLKNGAIAQPKIEVLTSGSEVVYDFKSQTILVGLDLVESAEQNNDDTWKLNIALTEEYGHHIDYLLRNVYSTVDGDGYLDEGARYAYNILNFRLDQQSSMEYAQHTCNTGSTRLTLEYDGLHKAIRKYLSITYRTDDDLWDGYEHFVCARTAGDRGPGFSFGHESIEDELRFAGFSENERVKIFFGNWTRDYNQIIVPVLMRSEGQAPGLGMAGDAKALSKPLQKLPDDGLFTRETLTDVVNLLAEIKFVNPDEPSLGSAEEQRVIFQITPERLGVYRPEEHQDNPSGLPDGSVKDPAFRGPVKTSDLEVDSATGMKRYIASPGSGSSYDFIGRYFSKAIEHGRTADGLRYFGMGLHVMEDFFCHTNMVEVCLYKLGHKEVELWSEPQSDGLVPLTSGIFGFADTVVSILYEIAHILSQAADCTHPGKRTAAQKVALILLSDTNPEWSKRLDGWLSSVEEVKTDYPTPFVAACHTREFLFGWVDKSIGFAIEKLVSLADDIQTFADLSETQNSADYTHSQMSKDHDDHPLHVLAATLAKDAVRRIGFVFRDAYRGRADIQDVMIEVKHVMTHPQKTQWMDVIVTEWAKNHEIEIVKAGDRKWLAEQSNKHIKTLKDKVNRFQDNYDVSNNFFEDLIDFYEKSNGKQ
jgi:hypothetical protein